jgi:hypothetical protein
MLFAILWQSLLGFGFAVNVSSRPRRWQVRDHVPERAGECAVKKQSPKFQAVETCADLMKLVKAAMGQPLEFKL